VCVCTAAAHTSSCLTCAPPRPRAPASSPSRSTQHSTLQHARSHTPRGRPLPLPLLDMSNMRLASPSHRRLWRTCATLTLHPQIDVGRRRLSVGPPYPRPFLPPPTSTRPRVQKNATTKKRPPMLLFSHRNRAVNSGIMRSARGGILTPPSCLRVQQVLHTANLPRSIRPEECCTASSPTPPWCRRWRRACA
jgi:hypothetical protein